MSYVKTTWVTGDIVTAPKMNNLESGVEANDLNKLNKPSDNGTAGQLLISNGDGSTSWTDTDTTLEESGKAADAKATGDAIGEINEALETKAEIDGYYEELTAGDAEQLISTVYVEDSNPYLFRTTGGSTDVGNREYLDSLVGGTIAWNQLADNSNFSVLGSMPSDATKSYDSSTDTTSYSATIGSNGYGYVAKRLAVVENHIYLLVFNITGTNITSVWGKPDAFGTTPTAKTYGSGGRFAFIQRSSRTQAENSMLLGISAPNGTAVTAEFSKVNIIDLTVAFGTTIADYVYSLEQATAGSGIAWLKQYIDLDTYHAYDAGTLKHVEDLQSHDTVGFNQWDEVTEHGYLGIASNHIQYIADANRIRSKNWIPVFPNTTYHYHGGGYGAFVVGCVDENGNGAVQLASSDNADFNFTTGTQTRFVKFACRAGYGGTYKNDVCINLSWSGYRNGEYEPYEKHSYALDSSVILRGVPTLADDKLVYDGDEYLYDGTINRRYGIVDLGTLTWTAFTQYRENLFYAAISDIAKFSSLLCTRYITGASSNSSSSFDGWQDKTIHKWTGSSAATRIYIVDESYTSGSDLGTSLSGVYLVYELATPTTETADPYTQVQICDDFGTEQFVTTSIIPVGTATRYPANLRDKLQHLPSLAETDGTYLIQQTNKEMTLVPITGYATDEDLEELDGKVDSLKTEIDAVSNVGYQSVPFDLSEGYIKVADGTVVSSSATSHTDYIDVSMYSYIKFKRKGTTNSSPIDGMVFYDATKTMIANSGVATAGSQATTGYLNDLAVVAVPVGAVYARFSAFTDTNTYGNFALYAESKISAEFDEKADVITNEVSGDVASFPDGAAMPVKSLAVNVDAVQNLNGYDNPWPEGGSNNKLNLSTATANMKLTGTNGTPVLGTGYSTSDYIPVTGGESYYFMNVVRSYVGIAGWWYDSNKADIESFTIAGGEGHASSGAKTAPANAAYVRVTWDSSLSEIAVNYPSTVTSYVPYSNICPITGWTKCNIKSYGLPYGYKPANYLSFNKTYCVIPTNYNFNSHNYVIWASFRFTEINQYSSICGVYKGEAYNATRIIETNGLFGCYLNNANKASSPVTIGGLSSVDFNKVGNGYGWHNVNGVRNTYSPVAGTDIDVTDFRVSSTQTQADIQYVLLQDASLNNKPILCLLPCTDPTGLVGMYDIVGQKFYAANDQTKVTAVGTEFPFDSELIYDKLVSVDFSDTVYGGTLDVTSGVLTVTHGIVDLGTLDWTVGTASIYSDYPEIYWPAGTSTLPDIICNIYKTVPFVTITSQAEDKVISASSSASRISVRDTRFTDGALFKQYLTENNAKLVFRLATPLTVQLTAEEVTTFLGQNNIFADTGTVDVVYRADTKLYVDNKVNTVQNLMELIITANHEDSMKASKAYTSGNLLIVNGTLYKATTSIASGATLTVGTNITATTVAAELASLS